MKLSRLVSFEGVFFAKPSVFSQEQGINKYEGSYLLMLNLFLYIKKKKKKKNELHSLAST